MPDTCNTSAPRVRAYYDEDSINRWNAALDPEDLSAVISGPSSSVANNIPLFSDTTGKLLKASSFYEASTLGTTITCAGDWYLDANQAAATTTLYVRNAGITGSVNLDVDRDVIVGQNVKLGTTGDIIDQNDDILIDFVADGNAVNYIQIENDATTRGPIIRAEGETNVDLRIHAKGTGQIQTDSDIQLNLGGSILTSSNGDLTLAPDGTGDIICDANVYERAGDDSVRLSGDRTFGDSPA
jgi:hypothetical protein